MNAERAPGQTKEPEGIDIDFSESLSDENWDGFLRQLPGAHHEQTSVWARFRRHFGWRPARWVAHRNGRVVGGVQVLIRKLPRVGEIGYIVRGPLCEAGQADVEEILVERITTYARKHRFVYQVIDLPYGSGTLAPALDREGYVLHPPGIPPSGLLKATLLLDIEPSPEILLKNMRTTVRQNIRTGEKAGFEMTLGTKEDLETFWSLMLVICRRRGSSPTPANPDFFDMLWDTGGSSGFVRLFILRLGEEIVSTAFAFAMGDTIRIWKVGWSGAHQNKFPNHLMWWLIIKWARENGFRSLDFVRVDEHDAELLAKGEKRPEAFRDGTTFFKMGFGGRLVMIPEARSQFFHPALRWASTPAMMRLFRSRIPQQLIRAFWSHSSG